MNRKMVAVAVAGCWIAGTALMAEEGQGPKSAQGLREHRGPAMMMEGGDMGEALIMRALAPDSAVARQLNLTPEQAESLKAIFKDGEKEQAELREKMKQAAVGQAELMMQDAPEEAAVMKGVETIGEIRIALAKLFTRKILAAQKVLTPGQRTKLRELMKEHREKMRARVRESREQRQERRKERRQEGEPPASPSGQPAPPPPAE